MYVALARTVWTDHEKDTVAEEVRRFRLRHPGLSNDKLVEKLIQKTALRCAAVGAIASAPPAFLSFLPLAADYAYQVLALNRLVLTIARIYGIPTTREQRGASVAASLALGGGTEFLRRSAVSMIQRALRRRAASRLIPFFGAVVGGAFNYTSILAVGKQAQEYYRGWPLLSRLSGR